MALCPCCGHEVEDVPVAELKNARLSAYERKLVHSLANAYPDFVDVHTLHDQMYSSAVNNFSSLKVIVYNLRRKLKPHGWTIPKTTNGGKKGFYRLGRIAD